MCRERGRCRGERAPRRWPHWSLLPPNQQSGEIACYLGSIFHALLNCFVLTRCQKWIVTLTQPEPGWGLQACGVGLISLQVEGRLGGVVGCLGSLPLFGLLLGLQRCFAALSNCDADEPVKGKAHRILLSIAISSSFVGPEK